MRMEVTLLSGEVLAVSGLPLSNATTSDLVRRLTIEYPPRRKTEYRVMDGDRILENEEVLPSGKLKVALQEFLWPPSGHPILGDKRQCCQHCKKECKTCQLLIHELPSITDPDCRKVAALLLEAFGGITLGNGTGLLQGQAKDAWQDEEWQAYNRAKDEKGSWSHLNVADLKLCSSSLCFFDAEGMLFHIPAYMMMELADRSVSIAEEDEPDDEDNEDSYTPGDFGGLCFHFTCPWTPSHDDQDKSEDEDNEKDTDDGEDEEKDAPGGKEKEDEEEKEEEKDETEHETEEEKEQEKEQELESFREKFALFNEAQKASVNAYLELVAATLEQDDDSIALARASFWSRTEASAGCPTVATDKSAGYPSVVS